jgi:hypothetical protein
MADFRKLGKGAIGALGKLNEIANAQREAKALKVKPPSDNIANVINANFLYPKKIGNQTVKIGNLFGGVRMSDPTEAKRVNDLAQKISSPEGYISRIIVDHDNNVIEGQHRLEALRQLGIEDVPVYKIEDLSETMPVDKMEAAVNSVGNIHPDNAYQLVRNALEHISEEGIDSARQMNYGKWQKHYDAALDAVSGMQSVLPAAEREANLAKFLEPSKEKRLMYHGTGRDIKEFKPGSANSVFVSPSSENAEAFGYHSHLIDTKNNVPSAENVMPLYVQVENPFDYENPAHIEALREYAEANKHGPKSLGRRIDFIPKGNWEDIEAGNVQDALKELGHDSFYVKEDDMKNLGIYDPKKVKSAIGNRGTYDITDPDITKAKGGVIHMAKAGKVGAMAEGLVGGLNKLNEIAKARRAATDVAEVDPAVQAVVMAADRAAAGRKAADVAKAIDPMKMSEALGNMNLEGKGKLKITQADRTRVGGGNIGGPMFSGLQQVDPIYDQAAWGVGKKSTASAMINDSDPNTLWSTVLGSADQLKSNPIVFNKLRKGFTDSMKAGNLSPELEAKINHNLALTFGEGADIRDPKIWNMANTYEKRGALADLMLGQGIAPGKGGVALGGEKSGKGVIFQPSEILKRETEPMLLHPEHGGDVPTFAIGPRLFNLSGETMTRPDLHPGYPVILKGEDMGVVFEPVAGKEAMPEFVKQYKDVKGREPTGYFDWTKGLVGEGAPTQPITEEYLTYLQKLGKKNGGAMQKPSWHVAVEKHMKDGGYTMVNEKHIPRVRSLKHLAKGGEANEESASLKELYDALPDFYDKAIKPEVESYKKPRAFTDLMNRGVIANNPISAGVDLVNFGLSGVDAAINAMRPTTLGELVTGKQDKKYLSSEKPFGGSEQIKDLMKKYNMTTDEERPIAETVLGFISPGSLVGGTIKGANTIKKAGTAMKDMATSKKARGGLTLMR